ncbi:AaceriAER358Cp [[Ashbya] aceris (nom. inval.)]|nr:AaceriAER358Cp [[Ashbya] aceris (nom. inval.)]
MTKASVVDQSAPAYVPKRLLAEARAASKVNIEQVFSFLEGSPEKAALTNELLSEFAADSVITQGPEYYDLTKAEQREQTVKKIARLALYLENDVKIARKQQHKDVVRDLQAPDAPLVTMSDIERFEKRATLVALIDPQLATRLGVNLSLFGNAVRGNGTDEQIRYWLQERGLMFVKGIYGCFAMTELGHGSNVANLQTRATYDPESDSFIIHTPDLVATKWWIGGAAHSATHSTVYARLIVEGKDYGVKVFVVPLRNPKTMELLGGISIGDIGSKMGRDGIDNGWIQFNNVRIPREYMLSRFTKVIPGNPPKVEVEPLLDSISGYAALLSGRVSMVLDSYRFGARFATIATRYAFGRQQFGDPSNETQLIEYPLHQFRVIPQLAIVYMMAPGAMKLMDTYNSCLSELYGAGDDKKQLTTVSARMKDLFVESASLKATCTWLTATLIDELRQTCGGHGYSSYNGFGKAYNDWVVQCTWEGDNNVLCLMAGKSLLKKFAGIVRGKKVSLCDTSMDYLRMDYIQRVVMGGTKKVSNLATLPDYYQIWSVILVKYLKRCAETVRDNNDPDSVSKLLVSIAKFHAFYSMLQEFHRKLASEESHVGDAATKDTLWKVYKLASIYFIDKFSGEFQQLKVMSPDQMTNVQEQMLALLPELKTHAIRLTDAFHLPDAVLNSSIGNYDGDIYHNYFNDVTRVAAKDKAPGVAPYANLLVDFLGRGNQYDNLNINEASFQNLGK